MARHVYTENYTLHKVRFRSASEYRRLVRDFEQRLTDWWLIRVNRNEIVVDSQIDISKVKRVLSWYKGEFSD